MIRTRHIGIILGALVYMLPNLVNAEEHVVNAAAREFKPAIIYIQPGDSVKFINMTSHNSVTYLIPEGGTGWGEKGKLASGSLITPALNTEGIYGYVCEPHIGFGMVGVVVVGAVSADDIAAMKERAMTELEGPFKRLIGKIINLKPTK
ncbi:MAG: plastocyanin/azurin family copper-binding protein [Gammaproteobacteria bacterium]|nr:plastocyanin/azurin family copper-binding protein [Gammaproteobacteria bacterium]